jgi:WD40 repeat protein
MPISEEKVVVASDDTVTATSLIGEDEVGGRHCDEAVEAAPAEDEQVLAQMDGNGRTEDDNKSRVKQKTVILEETPTFTALSIPSSIINAHDDDSSSNSNNKKERDAVLEQNQRYEAMLDQRRHENKDMAKYYREDRAAQTFHNSQRDKSTMWLPVEQADVEVGCNFPLLKRNNNESIIGMGDNIEENDVESSIDESTIDNNICAATQPQDRKDGADHYDKVLSSQRLLDRLHWMERAIQQDNHCDLQRRYLGLHSLDEAAIIQPKVNKEEEQQDSDNNSEKDLDTSDDEVINADLNGVTQESKDEANDMDAELMVDNENENRRQPHLELLCNLTCEQSKDRPIVAMDWSKDRGAISTDIVAVAYDPIPSNPDRGNVSWLADRDEDEGEESLILIWSFRDVSFPCKCIECSSFNSRVTSLAFPSLTSSLLAVGFENGLVALYDISQPSSVITRPLFDSMFVKGRHMLPVWALTWITKSQLSRMSMAEMSGPINGGEHSNNDFDPMLMIPDENNQKETLISVSGDGRILEWTYAPHGGLTLVGTWMTIRGNGTLVERSVEWGSTIGTCIDFIPGTNTSMYLVGAENGSILRCSSAHTENALKLHTEHTGPVLRIKCSPFLPNVFASSSMDYSVRVWSSSSSSQSTSATTKKDKAASLIVPASYEDATATVHFRPPDFWDTVNDIAWSPQNSTVLFGITEDGRLLVFDLHESVLDPIETHVCSQGTSTIKEEEWPLPEEEEKELANDGKSEHEGQPSSHHRPQERGTALRCMAFSSHVPVLAVGSASGDLLLYKHYSNQNTNSQPFSMESTYQVQPRVANEGERLRSVLSGV